jgi:4-diphosphocytidyl-2-C-methyl-D-erythritol kinase
VTVQVPAKINLRLAVGALRADGFHDIRTVFHAVDCYDLVTASACDGLELSAGGPESSGLPATEGNLAWRAAQLLAEHAGIKAAARLRIEKLIPIAAGLAGGSADAAGALLACDRLWELSLPAAELAAVAAQLGSDVAFALRGGTAQGTGRGEQLNPIEAAAEFHWVLAAADGELSTPAVYAELDRQRAETPSAPIELAEPSGALAALRSGDPVALAAELGNDLQPAAVALAPYLDQTLAAGRIFGALAGIVSGSGPTCVFLARDGAHAKELAAKLQASGSCRTARPVVGGALAAMVD